MAHRLTDAPNFVIRPLVGNAEIEMFHRLSVATFQTPSSSSLEEIALRYQRLVNEAPDFNPQQQRGAFLGDTFLGGYLIMERTMCIGPARLLTGCIADVVTLTEHRNKGIATALLHDALRFADEHQHTLLLLDGIPNFYHRFGFIDVLDICKHIINSQTVLALPQSTYQLRPATPADVPALLTLYQHHYGSRTGSFARDLALQEHYLRWRYQEPPLIAVNADNVPKGYMKLIQHPQQVSAYEVAADNWHAALALLQYHATRQTQVNAQDADLAWFLPPDAPTADLLADHLAVRTHQYHVPNADWMARPVHLTSLLHAMLPCWNERWQPGAQHWFGTVELHIGNDICALVVDTNGLYLKEPPYTATHHVRLTPQVFTQLLFGYRSVSWAAQQSGQHIPKELFPLLQALFPRGYAWINGTDAF